jgi:flagellar P-ring protein precursor FlgI
MRVKDLARVGGWRELELVGYGLVTGLRGSGDKAGNKPFGPIHGQSIEPARIVSFPPGHCLEQRGGGDCHRSGLGFFTARVQFGRPGFLDWERRSALKRNAPPDPPPGRDGQIYATAQGALASDPESGAKGSKPTRCPAPQRWSSPVAC